MSETGNVNPTMEALVDEKDAIAAARASEVIGSAKKKETQKRNSRGFRADVFHRDNGVRIDSTGKTVPADYGQDVLVRIPMDKLNKSDEVVSVSVNEFIWNVPRGVDVIVPEEVRTQLVIGEYI